LIATTNNDQAVHLDHDDRRWTVIEVPRQWDHSTEEGKVKANADWEPYWQFLRGDGPAIVLHYLLGFEVDRDLIRFGHITEAKADDKIQSNPVLAVLDEMAETGIATLLGKPSKSTRRRRARRRPASIDSRTSATASRTCLSPARQRETPPSTGRRRRRPRREASICASSMIPRRQTADDQMRSSLLLAAMAG